MTAALTRSIAT